MNDNPPALPKITPAELANRDVIRALEGALAAAKDGKLAGVGIIMVHGPDAMSMQSAGAFPSTLITGCHKMAAQILDNMFAKRSQILMPQRRM